MLALVVRTRLPDCYRFGDALITLHEREVMFFVVFFVAWFTVLHVRLP